MTLVDLPEVLALEKELFGDDAWSERMLRDELLDEQTRWYRIASEGETVVGYAGLAMLADEAHVMTIGTAPQVRGRGIGRRLLSELLAEAARRSARQVILEVRTDNAVAIALYESEGFRTVAVRKRYYQPEGADAAVMIRG